MPKKSRRVKMLQSKRKQERQRIQSKAVQQPVVKPASKPVASAPASSKPIPKVTSKTVRYPYVTAELRRIGILAGIILAILIVLALALP